MRKAKKPVEKGARARLKCPRCKYVWNYRGRRKIGQCVNCPSCLTTLRVNENTILEIYDPKLREELKEYLDRRRKGGDLVARVKCPACGQVWEYYGGGEVGLEVSCPACGHRMRLDSESIVEVYDIDMARKLLRTLPERRVLRDFVESPAHSPSELRLEAPPPKYRGTRKAAAVKTMLEPSGLEPAEEGRVPIPVEDAVTAVMRPASVEEEAKKILELVVARRASDSEHFEKALGKVLRQVLDSYHDAYKELLRDLELRIEVFIDQIHDKALQTLCQLAGESASGGDRRPGEEQGKDGKHEGE